jgi:prepilin peptidase CpaA
MSHAMQHWFLLAALAACAVAAVIDLRTGHIPDWLTLGVLAVAPLARAGAAFAHHPGWRQAVMVACLSILSAVGSAIIPALLARSGGLGGGDVKLFAAIGAACGIFVAFYAQTYAYVFAMVQALFVVLRQGKLKKTVANIRGLFAKRVAEVEPDARHASFTQVKFAPAIFAGLVVATWAQWKW